MEFHFIKRYQQKVKMKTRNLTQIIHLLPFLQNFMSQFPPPTGMPAGVQATGTLIP